MLPRQAPRDKCQALLMLLAACITCSLISEASGTFYEETNAGKVERVLKFLKDYGEKRSTPGVNQFVSCVVISDAEFGVDNMWRDPAGETNHLEGRLAFVENEKDPDPKKPNIHGEKILTARLLHSMMEVCAASSQACSNAPIVVLYSHQIPCSNILDTEDECAIHLPDWLSRVRWEGLNVNMVVGYSISFVSNRFKNKARPPRTNEQRSLWYMFMGDIPAFVFNGDNKRFVKQLVYQPPNMNVDTIQKRMYDCLLGVHMTTDASGSLVFYDSNANSCVEGQHVELMFSYFINYLMCSCSAQPQRLYDRDHLAQCSANHINNYITSKCPERGGTKWKRGVAQENNRKILRTCSTWAARTARNVGMPQPVDIDTVPVGRELSNNWKVVGAELPGQLQWYCKSWRDFGHDSSLVRCREGENLDLKLLCSESAAAAGGDAGAGLGIIAG